MAPNQPKATVAALPEVDVATQQAYLSLARRLRWLNQRICGLWPVPAGMEFNDAPRHLARAMASLGATVGLVEPPARLRKDASQTELFIAAAGEGIDSLTPVSARTSSPAGVIEQTLALVRDRYACILLDLSGLEIVDAHELALIPGVGIVLFIAVGKMNEFALAKMRRRLPPGRVIGAVLVDLAPANAVAIG